MSLVEIAFLSSGDTFGSDGRLQTCISVRTPGRSIPHRLRRICSECDASVPCRS